MATSIAEMKIIEDQIRNGDVRRAANKVNPQIAAGRGPTVSNSTPIPMGSSHVPSGQQIVPRTIQTGMVPAGPVIGPQRGALVPVGQPTQTTAFTAEELAANRARGIAGQNAQASHEAARNAAMRGGQSAGGSVPPVGAQPATVAPAGQPPTIGGILQKLGHLASIASYVAMPEQERQQAFRSIAPAIGPAAGMAASADAFVPQIAQARRAMEGTIMSGINAVKDKIMPGQASATGQPATANRSITSQAPTGQAVPVGEAKRLARVTGPDSEPQYTQSKNPSQQQVMLPGGVGRNAAGAIDSQQVTAAYERGRGPATANLDEANKYANTKHGIGTVDAANLEFASRGMNVTKSVDPKTGAVTYHDRTANPYIDQKFTAPHLGGDFTGREIGKQNAKGIAAGVTGKNAQTADNLLAEMRSGKPMTREYLNALSSAYDHNMRAATGEGNAALSKAQASKAERDNKVQAEADDLAVKLSGDTGTEAERVTWKKRYAQLTGADHDKIDFIKMSRGKDEMGADLGESIFRVNKATGTIEDVTPNGGSSSGKSIVMTKAQVAQMKHEEKLSDARLAEIIKANNIIIQGE